MQNTPIKLYDTLVIGFSNMNDCHGHTIRISPPLNISESEIGFLVECLEKVFLK